MLHTEYAHLNKKENEAYLKSLNTRHNEGVFPQLKAIHEEVFSKTDCLSCANCCRTLPALLNASDIKRIAKHIGINTKQFIRSFVLEDINGEMMLNGVPCKFLNDDNSCSIYEIRPDACRRYPHTDEKEYIRRATLNLANTLTCPAAYEILEKLKKTLPAHDI